MIKNENFSVKREIINAVMQLMTEKSYMDITVTDIVNTAGVARASFYRNFNAINDVIEVIVEEHAAELFDDIITTLNSNDERKWREFLFNQFYLFAKKQREMENIRFENRSVFFNRMDNHIHKMESQFPMETISDRYSGIAKMGMLSSILKKWTDNGMKEAPEEMIDYIMSFILTF